MKVNINISEFLEKFNAEYEFLYNNYDRVAGFEEAVAAFDQEFLPNHREFVSEFCNFRGDLITSDRECAAFMFAMENYM